MLDLGEIVSVDACDGIPFWEGVFEVNTVECSGAVLFYPSFEVGFQASLLYRSC